MLKRNYLMLALLTILMLPLMVCRAEAAEYDFQCTAPPDLPDSVAVSAYEIRICFVSDTSAFNWDAADLIYQFTGRTPLSPGETEIFHIDNLPVETPLTCAVRSRDDATNGDGDPAYNWSGNSNKKFLFFADEEPPVAIWDFR